MSGVEDAQRLTVETFSFIDRHIGEFVDELACAGLADAAAAEIVARTLLAVLLDQRAVDQRVSGPATPRCLWLKCALRRPRASARRCGRPAIG